MRKLYLLLAWLSLSASALSQNLVAYYPFNGNANDQSGNAINPTYIGSGVTLTTDRFGNANRAYDFDGATGSYMRMPSNLLPTTNRTVSLWFNATSVSIRPVMLGYGGQADLGYGTSFLMGLNISGCGCYHTQAHYYTNQVSYNYSTDPVNQWIHWVVTINGNTTKMYVNGTLVANVPGSFTSNTYVSGRDFSIGVPVNVSGVAPYTDVNGGYFQGKLDDIRIYDAAMSDAQVQDLYTSESLVAYYPFNGNANDESGNNHNGTVTEAVLTTDINGTANKAYQFDGVNDVITAPAHTNWSFGNGDFSITSFVNVSTIGTSRIVSAGYTANDGIWGLGFGSHPVWGSGLRINYFIHSGGDYRDYSSNEITGYSIGQWAFVGVTKTGSTLTFYFNGQQAGTATIPYVSNANSYLSIGSRQLTSGTHIEFFNGKIDAVRIYNRSLTSVEILQQYKNESTGLVAYYPFNGNANDESGNGNNGTVNGATLTTDRYGNANKAYNFNGANNFISVADNPELFSDELTLSWWYKVPEYSGTRVVIGWVNGGNRYQQFFSGNSFAYFNGYYNSCCYFNPTYNLTIVNQWQHVAVTYKKTNTSESVTSLYINGELKQTDNHAAAITYQPGSTFFIGKTHDGGYFNGELDDIRVYSRLLSPNEILQLADVPIMPDLIAYLPMNGNANDMSGNSHNGTVVNAPPATDKYDNANSAYQFNGNGTGTSITLANSTSLDFYENFSGRSFSLSAWIKMGTNTNTSEPKQIIGKHNCGTPNGYILLVENGKFGFWMSVNGTWFPLTTTETYNDGKWHHVVATYDVIYQRLYVDGELKGSMGTAYNSPAYGAPVKIGEPSPSGGCGGTGVFNGKVDEVKIYGSALDASQVTALYKQSRGSGNALKLNGNNYIDIGNLGTPHFFTIEAWIKRNDNGANQHIISGNNANSWSFGASGNRLFVSMNGASTVTSADVPQINDGKWHHVAVAFQDGPMNFYVDGVHAGWVEIGTAGLAASNYSIGTQFSPGNSFNGEVDEIRIWDWVLDADNIDTIRSWMNRKITSSHPVYSNLVRYYNFDEKNVTKTYDMAAAATGIYVNGVAVITSGAAIGDISKANFSNPMTHGTTLVLNGSEQFSVSEPANPVDGVSIYVVKDPPEVQTGILGLGSNDHYFGVHISTTVSPTLYTATYNYSGNPFVSTSTELTLQLFKRADNSATTWANSGATLNTTANTLTVTGQNTEYILGSSGFGLPVTLLSFQAQKINATTAKLTWQTATELNNKGFEVQRSFDGNYFVNVGFVNGAGTSDVLKEYSTTDIPGKTGRVYYRLKQEDLDGKSKLSQIVSVLFDKQGLIKVYPNPAQQQVVIEGVDQYSRIQLLDAAGKLVKEQLNNNQYLLTVNLDGLKSGMYLLRLINGKENQTIKLIIEN